VNQKGQGKPTTKIIAQESQNYATNYIPANSDKASFSGGGMNASLLEAVHNRALQLGGTSQVQEYAQSKGLTTFRQVANSMKQGEDAGVGLSNLASVLNAFKITAKSKPNPT
jgi:hypothetical protein